MLGKDVHMKEKSVSTRNIQIFIFYTWIPACWFQCYLEVRPSSFSLFIYLPFGPGSARRACLLVDSYQCPTLGHNDPVKDFQDRADGPWMDKK